MTRPAEGQRVGTGPLQGSAGGGGTATQPDGSTGRPYGSTDGSTSRPYGSTDGSISRPYSSTERPDGGTEPVPPPPGVLGRPEETIPA